MQAMLARRQLEQGDLLSQRTLRLLQVTQLRNFVVGVAGGAGTLACFSARVSENVANGACDMLDAFYSTMCGWI